jgi:hypothetical protein
MHFVTSRQPSLSLGIGGHTCTWGTHLCALFESDAERDELFCRVTHEGDLEGSLQVVVHSAPSPDAFISEYAARFPADAQHPRDPERFELRSSDFVYYPEGRFGLDTISQRWESFRQRAQAEHRTIRLTADMDWALRDVPGTELLLAYEAKLDDYLFDKPFLTVCAYDLRRFSGATVMGVLLTHRFTISRGMIVENPYYDPRGWLRQHAPGLPAIGA